MEHLLGGLLGRQIRWHVHVDGHRLGPDRHLSRAQAVRFGADRQLVLHKARLRQDDHLSRPQFHRVFSNQLAKSFNGESHRGLARIHRRPVGINGRDDDPTQVGPVSQP